ncbi:MAG: hypothetical protein KJO28_06585 [Desulfofustis sp.]|nr:hypothetical protein [Desulfofustis sp.]
MFRQYDKCTYVEVYDDLLDNMGSLHLDECHPDGQGFDLIADNIPNALAYHTEM